MSMIELSVDQVAALAAGRPQPVTSELRSTSSAVAQFVGKTIVVRTVTMTICGVLTGHDDTFLTVVDASWVADSGRWAQALTTGSFSEVEPFPDGPVLVGVGAVIDLVAVAFTAPRQAK